MLNFTTINVLSYSNDIAVCFDMTLHYQNHYSVLNPSVVDQQLTFSFSTYSSGLYYFYISYSNEQTGVQFDYDTYFKVSVIPTTAIQHDYNYQCAQGEYYCIFNHQVIPFLCNDVVCFKVGRLSRSLSRG